MATNIPKAQNPRHKKLSAKQIRFRQHANKIKKAWQGKPEKIRQTIEKILEEYAGKGIEQQLLLAYIELLFNVFRKPIIKEDPVKYDLILSWVRKRKAEVVSEVFFYAFKFKWENKYWVTKLSQLNATKNARGIIKRNLSEGTPGDDLKTIKVNIYQLLQNGVFPDVNEFNPVDIAEVISAMKSLEYFDKEILDLEKSNTADDQPPSNLLIQVNQNSESDTLNGPDEVLSINIPINKITDAIKASNPYEPEISNYENQQFPPLELYNRKQAAKILQVSEPTLDRYVRDGILNYCTIGEDGPKRYRREDLEACLISRNKMIRR